MIIKTIKDYIGQVKEKFPYMPEQDIRKILTYGWSQYLSYNRLGCDTDLRTDEFAFLTGRIPINRFKQYKLYQQKLARKLRVIFKKKQMEWDGYYYFCIDRRQYREEYLPQVRKPMAINKGVVFHDIYLYMLQDECKAARTYPKYMFRVPYIDKFGFKIYLTEYKPHQVECIGFVPAWKFHDLLITRKQYDILNGNYAKHV